MALRGKLEIQKWQTRNVQYSNQVQNYRIQSSKTILHEYQVLIWNKSFFFFRFDIRLMKEGRMKGQAFITLPSEDKAKKALRDVHGYILQGKPMVIVSLNRLFSLHQFRGDVDVLST